MTLTELVTVISQWSVVLFVVTNMLAMALSLTVAQIVEPLRNTRLVILMFLANFLLVPLLAYAILLVIPLGQPDRIGLILLSTAAGAPFLPKLAQAAKGSVAFAVGIMVLLMVTTVAYMPIVLPLLLPGVSVRPWDIAQSLIVLMLIPLAIGLLVRWYLPGIARRWQPVMSGVSSLALVLLLVTTLGLHASNIIRLIGTGGILALLLFIAGCFAIGFTLGARDTRLRSVTALGTAQRNVSASVVVSAQNFAGTGTLPFVLVAGIVLLLVMLPTARALAGRVKAAPAVSEQPTQSVGQSERA